MVQECFEHTVAMVKPLVAMVKCLVAIVKCAVAMVKGLVAMVTPSLVNVYSLETVLGELGLLESLSTHITHC